MTPSTLASRRILIVDDDRDFLGTLTDVLATRGFGAVTAPSAWAGLEALQKMMSEPPPVALIDLRLPDMDGIELIERLHAISQLTQVVVLTGHASVESAVDALRGRSFDYLQKPVVIDELVRTLEAARDRWHQHVVEDVVRQERQRQAEILEVSPVGMLIVDRNGVIEYMNRPAESILGVSRGDVVGKRASEWVDHARPAKAHGEEQRVVNQVLRTGGVVRDVLYTIEAPGQERRIVSVSGAPLTDAHGNVQGVVESLADVTDRVRMEESLRQSHKLEAIGRLAGSVAHDFNNVLTVILSTSGLLLQDFPEPSTIRDDLRAIQEAAQRAHDVTRQLLALSRRQPNAPEHVALTDAVKGMERLITRVLTVNHVLELDLVEGIPSVRMDPVQLQQILMNLCVNARDAMEGGGTLTIRTRAATVDEAEEPSGHPTGRWAVLEVADTGHGMTESTRQKMFEPFFTTKTPDKGTGLGLATVYGFVSQAGGRVEVDSTVGLGSTFTIWLPEAVGDTPSLAQPAGPDVADAGMLRATKPTGPCTILLVQGDDALRAETRRGLVRRGHTVVEASHGREAESVAMGLGRELDVLITGDDLAGLTPAEFVDALTSLAGFGLILLAGGDGDERWTEVAATVERLAVVKQPADVTELLEAVERVRPDTER